MILIINRIKDVIHTFWMEMQASGSYAIIEILKKNSTACIKPLESFYQMSFA